MNGGILIALLASKFLGLWWCDAVFAIGIGLWIIRNAVPIVWSGIIMLLDRSLDKDSIEKIEKFIREEKGIEDFHLLDLTKKQTDYLLQKNYLGEFRLTALTLIKCIGQQ